MFPFTNPTVISKILLPIELDKAMSPKPFLATRIEVTRSGTEVPAAKNVRPITSEGMPKVSPTRVAHQTMRYEKIAIQMIEPTKQATNQRFFSLDKKKFRKNIKLYIDKH